MLRPFGATDVAVAFHFDKIQGLIAKHSSEPFEIEMYWVERQGQVCPIIVVPAGVRSPVAVRSPILNGQTPLVREHAVYIRSLKSNNTPATTEATWRDWPDVVDRCFENRQADIGRFVRRHLTPDLIRQLTGALGNLPAPPPTLEEQAWLFLEESSSRFAAVRAALPEPLRPHGAWEVAAVAGGPLQSHPVNTRLLSLLSSSNPNYTGWPLWLDSRGFSDASDHPHVLEGAWETSLLNPSFGHIDFWRATGGGRFYHRRAFEDDTASARWDQGPEPGTRLEFAIAIQRTTEAIAVPLEFIRAMGGTTEETEIAFAFRWRGLKGRKLSSWANPRRMIPECFTAHQDDYTASIVIPLTVSTSALPAYTIQIVQPLLEIFDGIEITPKIVEEIATNLLDRKR